MNAYIVGAGPGDPGLLTLRGAEILRSAEVLLYDALVSEAILDIAPPQCEKIHVGKRCGAAVMSQDAIVALMLERCARGERVVRLKGGDPFVFGRGGEEVHALTEAGLSCEVVPGISSALAAPAAAGIPVTHRGVSASFIVVTGHEDPCKPQQQVDWTRLAGFDGTIVALMALRELPSIADRLMRGGLAPSTPACVIENGTLPQQRAIEGTLETIAETARAAGVQGPATIVFGQVVALRSRIAPRALAHVR